MKRTVFLSFIASIALASAQATVTLPKFMTSNMVIQRNSEMTIPGTATPGATVSVTPSWDNVTVTAVADTAGKFLVKLNTPKAGGPYTITFDDGAATVLSNVLSGEVWVCSGQSNMEMPVIGWGKINNYEEEAQSASRFPRVRLLKIAHTVEYGPTDDTEVNNEGWMQCSYSTVSNFSALAFLFAKYLFATIHVPIGVIDCSWSGTPAESWVSYKTAKEVGGFESFLGTDQESFQAKMEKARLEYPAAKAKFDSLYEANVTNFDKSVAFTDGQPISMGSSWEQQGFGDYDGVMAFQRTINLDTVADAKIYLSEIDDEDQTYINGNLVGSTSSYTAQRVYDVPKSVLKKGENLITIIVTDNSGWGGIWQNVSLMHFEIAGKSISLLEGWTCKKLLDYANKPADPNNPQKATVLYNAMLYPLHILPIRGFLWYQGEANVGRDAQYTKLFKGLINNWRSLWGEKKPFYFVQLAGYQKAQKLQPASQIAALRQAQANALALPYTGMATAVDIGNEDDIHPKNKQEVARRMVNMVINDVYGLKRVCRAPTVENVEFSTNKATIQFSSKVLVNGSTPEGFILELRDGSFVYGNATLSSDGTTIDVTTDKGVVPKSVRYDWADYPNGNVYGSNSLPVYPFRSDRIIYQAPELADGYYNIISDHNAFYGKGKLAMSTLIGDYLTWHALVDTDARYVFYVQRLDNGDFSIKSLSTGRYIDKKSGRGVTTTEELQTPLVLEYDCDGLWYIKNAVDSAPYAVVGSGSSVRGYIGESRDDDANLNRWRFVKNEIANGIKSAMIDGERERVDVYTVDGVLLKKNVLRSDAASGLHKGIYIIGKNKVILQ